MQVIMSELAEWWTIREFWWIQFLVGIILFQQEWMNEWNFMDLATMEMLGAIMLGEKLEEALPSKFNYEKK